MGLPQPGQAAGGLGLGPALVALAHGPSLTGMSVGGSGPSGGAGPTRWGKGGTQNQGQEELIRRQPRRARGHNRAEGPPGTAPSLPRINREIGRREKGGVSPGGAELEPSQGGIAPSCPAGHLLGEWLGVRWFWQAGQVPSASLRIALSLSHGTYMGRQLHRGDRTSCVLGKRRRWACLRALLSGLFPSLLPST